LLPQTRTRTDRTRHDAGGGARKPASPIRPGRPLPRGRSPVQPRHLCAVDGHPMSQPRNTVAVANSSGWGPSRAHERHASVHGPVPAQAAADGHQSGHVSVTSRRRTDVTYAYDVGRNSDGRDGERTGNTGHQRSLTVNNGHSKRSTDQERNAVTRVGEHRRAGVRFPPAPRKPPSTRGNAANGRRDRSPVQHTG
jgi:hypothetical protein